MAAALLDLLEVAQAGYGMALADGKGAVGKVEEHFAALQVVTANGFCGVALGGMRQHQYRETILLLNGLQFGHEAYGAGGRLGTAAQAGNVINYQNAGTAGNQYIFDGIVDVIGIAGKFVCAGSVGVKNQTGKTGAKL